MGNKTTVILIVIILVLSIALVGLLRFAASLDDEKYILKLSLQGEQEITVEYGTDYDDPGYTAWISDAVTKQQMSWKPQVTVDNPVDSQRPGTYTVTYHATYQQGDISLTATAQRTVYVVDTQAPVITLTTDPDYYVIPGNPYVEEGFTAHDNCDGDLTAKVTVSEENGIVTYRVKDNAGNEAVVQRPIRYHDPEAPVITLTGDNPLYLKMGATYREPGYTAMDNVDGDITRQVEVTMGDGVVTYFVRDSYGNEATATRVIIYEDTQAPVITLKGENPMTINVGKGYVEPGFTAMDNCDGDITVNVTVSGEVQKYVMSTYTLTYTVTDKAGNVATAERIVVVAPFERPQTDIKSEKVIYLTFDDGPSAYTLLDVLDKYNVKATFFVVNTPYIHLVKDIVSRGHAVGIHSVTHEFASIYASDEAYLDDLFGMQQIIYNYTGVTTTLMRFPGGSSNTVSSFNPGIMTRMAQQVQAMGFKYFDWDVDSQDAGGASTAQQVKENVIAGIRQQKRYAIVLQHDIKSYSVQAVEEIIIWGLQNGYVFLPLDPTSPTTVHRINN